MNPPVHLSACQNPILEYEVHTHYKEIVQYRWDETSGSYQKVAGWIADEVSRIEAYHNNCGSALDSLSEEELAQAGDLTE